MVQEIHLQDCKLDLERGPSLVSHILPHLESANLLCSVERLHRLAVSLHYLCCSKEEMPLCEHCVLQETLLNLLGLVPTEL